GEEQRAFEEAGAAACAFSPDGKRMASAGYDPEKRVSFARLWDVETGKELRRFAAGEGRLTALAFSPDGATLAGGGFSDTRFLLGQAATGRELQSLPGLGRETHSVAFSPDGKTLAVADDCLYLYDPGTGKERLRIEHQARGLAFSPDGSVLIGAVAGAI